MDSTKPKALPSNQLPPPLMSFLLLPIWANVGVMQFFKVAKLDETNKDGSVFLKQIHMMEAKFTELENLFTHVPFYQAIVFLNHRGRAADLVKFLTRKGWPAMHIASGISQEERLAVMTKARKFELRVLVCSDLVSLGNANFTAFAYLFFLSNVLIVFFFPLLPVEFIV